MTRHMLITNPTSRALNSWYQLLIVLVVPVVVLTVTTIAGQPLQQQHYSQSGLSCSGQSCAGLTGQWSCQEFGFCDDVLGFEAIHWLHRQLDDDHNGAVDVTESNEFLRDELKYDNGYERERQKAFHGNDKHISVDELWRAWKASQVRNWTVDQTVEWLRDVVELPQYETHFLHNAVDGLALPRLAANTQFISILGISNPIHKQKLALKAMDVVLFGAPKQHNYIKDVLLILSVVIAIGGVWFAYVQHKYSQSHLKKMMSDMDSLQRAEEQLTGLQRELDRTRREQQMVVTEKTNLEKKLRENESQIERSASYTTLSEMSRIGELEDELKRVREELRAAHNSSGVSSRWAPPVPLQHWLQLTHEIEMKHFNAKRCAAELQLYAAKEGCEKLRRKRASVLGAFRVAHGNSIDDIDNRILQAKTALKEVTQDLQERVQRWHKIEMYCNLSVVHNPGIAYLEQMLYGSDANSPSGSAPTIGLSHAGSEQTIVDDESIHTSDSMANITDIGLHSYDKSSLLSLNMSSGRLKNRLNLNNTTSIDSVDDSNDDMVVDEDIVVANGSFTIDNRSIKDDMMKGRPKMAKSFSEDHQPIRAQSSDQLCHSESCSQLEECDSMDTLSSIEPTISVSDYPTNNNNSKKSVNKSSDELSITTVSSEKKRSFFGLRKRKSSKH